MGGESLRPNLALRQRRRAFGWLTACLSAAGLLAAACDSGSYPTAPKTETGHTIALAVTANPTTITPTGSSTIEVQVTENNLPVRVGTQIRVTTDLGQITEQVIATDKDGLAFTTLVADGRLGTATVTATSGANTDKTTKVTIGDTSLAASFTCTASELTVIFTDSSTGTTLPNTWSWDFGDGTGSSEQDPVHTYPAGGTYLMTLTVANEGAEDSVSKFLTVPLPGATCP